MTDQPQKIQTAKDYEMKPTTIQTPNRFQPLQEFPSLPYSVVVETPASKIQKDQSTSSSIPQISSNFNSTDSDTPYFTKNAAEHIILTSYTQIPNYNTLQVLINKIFPQNCHWLEDPIKTQKFYELILVDSGSAEISHTPDRRIPSQISYSKCVIKKVISPKEWASIWSTKDFSIHYNPKGYNYQDYRMAWYRAFLYRPFNHSWFFTFHSNGDDNFPIWFYDWWLQFGPVPNILPQTISKALQTWLSKTTGEHYKKLVSFYKSFKVPWIFCWSYKILQYHPKDYPLSLVREFKVKWWNKFNQDLCTEQIVLHYIQTGKKLNYNIHQVSQQLAQKDRTAPPTPAKPTKPAKSIIQEVSSSDSEEDDTMKQFIEFQKFKKLQRQMKKPSSNSKHSSQGSSTDQMGGPCAQDPFDL